MYLNQRVSLTDKLKTSGLVKLHNTSSIIALSTDCNEQLK